MFALQSLALYVPAASEAPGGGTPHLLSAAGAMSAAGSASLTVGKRLAANGAAQAAGTAALSVGKRLASTGAAQAAGTAAMSVEKRLAASGAVQAAGTASLAVSNRQELHAAGAVQAAGTARLTVEKRLAGAGAAESHGSARLSVEHWLAASGSADALGFATLSVPKLLQAAGAMQAAGSAALSTAVASESVEVGRTLQLTVLADGSPYDGAVTWASSNPAAATVSASGRVAGLGEGSATITATVLDPEGALVSISFQIVIVPSSTGALAASDLLEPLGRLIPSLFPADSGGTLAARLNQYLTAAYAEARIAALGSESESARNQAARWYAYAMAFDAIALRLNYEGATVEVEDAGKRQRLREQIAFWSTERDKATDRWELLAPPLVAESAAPTPPSASRLPSRSAMATIYF